MMEINVDKNESAELTERDMLVIGHLVSIEQELAIDPNLFGEEHAGELPWTTHDKTQPWAWENALTDLYNYCLSQGLSETEWTLNKFNATMMRIRKHTSESIKHLETNLEDFEYSEYDCKSVLAAMNVITHQVDSETASDPWAVACYIHKQCDNFHEALRWTIPKIQKIQEFLAESGILIQTNAGEETNE